MVKVSAACVTRQLCERSHLHKCEGLGFHRVNAFNGVECSDDVCLRAEARRLKRDKEREEERQTLWIPIADPGGDPIPPRSPQTNPRRRQ